MNNLMIFEGQEVECFEYEGKVLFNPRHVARCLDISDVKSTMRNFNDNQVVKLTNSKVHSTHFRKLHNTGENFLTESGVYKLIFKSRKPSAEKFSDWVTDEVLPTLREKGSYSLKPQENQSCTPTIKLYKGVPVVTVKDVVNQIGLSRGVIRTALKHGILNKDYWLLKGAELFRFKTIYPEFKTAKSLYVIAESGVKKLCKFLEVQSFPLIPKEQAVPAVNPAEKLTKVSKEEDYGIKYPLEVLHKLMNISKERRLDLTLRPFKACYSVLYRDTVGIQETLPIHQIIYEIAFELAHSILHKGRHVVGNQDCNKRAHQTAVSFIKTLDVLSTQ